MTVSELPKQVMISRPIVESALGIQPTYVLEVVSLKTLKHRMIHDIKPDMSSGHPIVKAPHGYRIFRMWKGRVSVDSEIFIQ